jgi:AIPR protein
MIRHFERSLTAQVRTLAHRFAVTENQAFLIWFMTTTLDLSEDEALEAASIDGANDKGIDSFYVDNDQGRVIILQGKYSETMNVNVREAHLTSLQASLNWLTSPEALRREGRNDLAQAAEDYLKAIRDGYGIELWFVYTVPRLDNIEKMIDVYNRNPDNVEASRSLRHFSQETMEAVWHEREDQRARRISTETIRLGGHVAFKFDGEFGRAIAISIPANELVRLYDKYGDLLFDRNVRLFLGNRKGSINAGIAETLRDDRQRGKFWAFNNGITMLCDAFEVDNQEEAVKVSNFNIINGCQTTVSVAQAPGDLAGVHVLARIINPPNDIVDDIIKYNNSQNPIKMWDIASQHKAQRRLRREFEQLPEPYIYLTRRGSRPTGGLAKFRDRDGKLRQIQFEQAGQNAAAFRGQPVLAYKDKTLIFMKHHDEMFPPDARVAEVLFQTVCGEICRETVVREIAKGNQDDNRILKRGGAFFVLAAMAAILELRNGAIYLGKLELNRIQSVRMAQRLGRYAEFALNEYLLAAKDEVEVSREDLSTLVRSPQFYERARQRIHRSYRNKALAEKWLEEALPKL